MPRSITSWLNAFSVDLPIAEALRQKAFSNTVLGIRRVLQSFFVTNVTRNYFTTPYSSRKTFDSSQNW